MNQSEPASQFVQHLTQCQSRLYGFILSMVCNGDQASEVLQETNLVLWKKADQFELGTNFIAWAFKVARFQVMAYRQRFARDRHVFNDEIVNGVADVFERTSDDFDRRQAALTDCLDKLQPKQRQLITDRYEDGMPVNQIAKSMAQSANAIAVAIYRVRVNLMKCIQTSTSQEQA
jgi:RNA polymerase sigma-70 factor (ECF subfamily)